MAEEVCEDMSMCDSLGLFEKKGYKRTVEWFRDFVEWFPKQGRTLHWMDIEEKIVLLNNALDEDIMGIWAAQKKEGEEE